MVKYEKMDAAFLISNDISIKFLTNQTILPINLQILLNQLDENKSESRHIQILKEIIQQYEECIQNKQNDFYVLETLIKLCINLGSKKSLRKYVYKQLTSPFLFGDIFIMWSERIWNDLNETNSLYTEECIILLNFLFMYMQNFGSDYEKYHRFLTMTREFYRRMLEIITSQIYKTDCFQDRNDFILNNSDVYTILDYTLRHLLAILAKINDNTTIKYHVEFVELCFKVLMANDQLKYETTNKCTLLFTYFLYHLPNEYKNSIKNKKFPILDFLEHENIANFELIVAEKRLKNIFIEDKIKLLLLTSIASSVDPTVFNNYKISEQVLGEFLFTKFITFGKLMTGIPDQIILISRALSEMSQFEVLKNAEIYQEGFDFAWGHLDHFVESVVHSTKVFFRKLVVSALDYSKKEGDSNLLVIMFQALNTMSKFSKVRLVALDLICDQFSPEYVLEHFNQLQNFLISVIPDTDMGQLAGTIYIKIMLKHLPSLNPANFNKIWLKPVLHIIKQNCTNTNTSVHQRIITSAIERKPEYFRSLFPSDYKGNNQENVIILRCINKARNVGIKFDVPSSKSDKYWRGFILKKYMEHFMVDSDEEVRLWALQAVAECQKSTELFDAWELTFLRKYIVYNIATQIPSVRKKINGFYKKILARYYASLNVIHREQNQGNVEFNEIKDVYVMFLDKIVGILLRNLAPDSNFSRRTLSLEFLILIEEYHSNKSEWIARFSEDDVFNLKNLINDGFESNKAMVIRLLEGLPSEKVGFMTDQDAKNYFEKCLKLTYDAKPGQTITASYMFQLLLNQRHPILKKYNKINDIRFTILNELINSIDLSYKELLDDRTNEIPLHGPLLSIRTLLSMRKIHDENNHSYAKVFEKIFMQCMEIKELVMPVVCNQAPEGYLPPCEETVDITVLQAKSQLCLVYAWKTMKEIMLLLGELVKQTVCLEGECAMLAKERLLEIGEFFLDIFVQTKHRGVFEQAGVAFAIISEEFVKSKNKNISILPMKWLEEAISLCTGQKTDDRLCATRRSAGLPFLILSVVSTQAETNVVYFQKTIQQLLIVANKTNEKSDEQRTHCLNILRFMFLNSKLGDLVPAYVGSASIASLKGFESRNWRVRNSATLLYSALITRIFGVQRTSDSEHLSSKNRLTIAVFYMRYPRLFEYLLLVLGEECRKVDSLILHPVLLMLARLYSSHNERINEEVLKLIACVNICISNPSYRTRDLAARASVSLIPVKLVSNVMCNNFDRIACKKITDTECHGLLLQVWHLLKNNRMNEEELPIGRYLEQSLHIIEQTERRFSHTTVALSLEVILLLIIRFKNVDNYSILKKLLQTLVNFKSSNEISTNSGIVWNRFQLILCILLNKLPSTDTSFTIIAKEVILYIYGENLSLKRNMLYFFIHLNQISLEGKFNVHPLIVSGDVEIPNQIQILTESFKHSTRIQLLKQTHILITYFLKTRIENICNDENIVLILMLLNFYPCVIRDLVGTNYDFFYSLVKFGQDCDNDEVISSIIQCLARFVPFKGGKFGTLIHLLMTSAASGRANFLRLSVAQFLVATGQQLFQKYITTETDRYNSLNIILLLLEDDELYIRNTMSMLSLKPGIKQNEIIPYKSRINLFSGIKNLIQKDLALLFLASWSIRSLPEVSCDTSKLFDRSELNPFAENIPVIETACKQLAKLFWCDKHEDNGIPLEIRIQNRSQTLMHCFDKYVAPMVHLKTVGDIQEVTLYVNLVMSRGELRLVRDEFCEYFNTVLSVLRENMGNDYFNAKYLFSQMCYPILGN